MKRISFHHHSLGGTEFPAAGFIFHHHSLGGTEFPAAGFICHTACISSMWMLQ